MSQLVTIHGGGVDLLTAVVGAVTRLLPDVEITYHEGEAWLEVADPPPNPLKVVEVVSASAPIGRSKFDAQKARDRAGDSL